MNSEMSGLARELLGDFHRTFRSTIAVAFGGADQAVLIELLVHRLAGQWHGTVDELRESHFEWLSTTALEKLLRKGFPRGVIRLLQEDGVICGVHLNREKAEAIARASPAFAYKFSED